MVYLFLLLVCLAPLPLGGNNPLAWTLFAFCAGLLVTVHSLNKLVSGDGLSVPFKKIALPSILFFLVCLWALIQSLSITPESMHHILWKAASDALGEHLTGAISINPYETRTTLMRLMTYGAVFWLALQLGRDRENAGLMLNAMGFAIAAYAFYGLTLFAIGSETILWYEKKAYAGNVTATFINRNTFATFAGTGVIILLGLFLHQIRKVTHAGQKEQLKYKIQRLLNGLSGSVSLYFLALIATLGALFLSNSRAGVAATLLAIAVLLLITLARRRIGKFGIAIMVVGAMVGLAWLFSVSGDRLASRLATTDLQFSGRMAAYRLTLKAIGDFPILGTGYGTFADVFPMYRDDSLSSYGIWDKAHNTYLEVAMELGLPAAFALFFAIGYCIWLCLNGVMTRRRDSHFALIGLCASVLMATHAFFDFSIQIPGFAITYAALLGLCCAQSWSSGAWAPQDDVRPVTMTAPPPQRPRVRRMPQQSV